EEKFCGSGNIHTPDYNGRRLLRTAIYLQRLSSRRRRATVHLLRLFMGAEKVADNKIMWCVIIHLAFVVSAFGMAYIDRMSKNSKG
ncbi:MAG: hypothetical protein RAM38_13125, partial [Arsenophonus sp.]|nr:hypothetical protein [Arsenophonus sp.]